MDSRGFEANVLSTFLLKVVLVCDVYNIIILLYHVNRKLLFHSLRYNIVNELVLECSLQFVCQ